MTRMRRLRRTEAMRSLVRETHLRPGALVAPMFLCPGEGVRREIGSMPGVFNLSIDEAVQEAEACAALGLGGLLLFGLPEEKDEQATGAWDRGGIVQRGLRALKKVRALDSLVVIADVRSHGYYDPGMQRIKNSIRVEPHRLKEELTALREFMAPECEIYIYCSCIRDTTSVRVARSLAEENCRTQVIEGGIKAWIKAGGALELVPEGDLQKLPRFE